jgi:hypothetical protein
VKLEFSHGINGMVLIIGICTSYVSGVMLEISYGINGMVCMIRIYTSSHINTLTQTRTYMYTKYTYIVHTTHINSMYAIIFWLYPTSEKTV